MALYWILFVALALQSEAVYGQDISHYINQIKNQASVMKAQVNLLLSNLQQTIGDMDLSDTSKIADDVSSLTDIQNQLNSLITSLKSLQKVSSLLNSATDGNNSGHLGHPRKPSKSNAGLF